MSACPSLPAGGRRLVVIHNPQAGRRRHRRLAAVLALLQDAGCTIDLRPTGRRGDAETLARQVTAAQADVVVAAGGDGTINEVVNGLAAAPGPVPPLAVLPLGTANVLAAEIGLGIGVKAMARAISHGQPRRIHLGSANGRHFVLMAGVGLDAQVVAQTDAMLKKHMGKLAYIVQILLQLWRYPFPACRVTIDGRRFDGRGVVVCNGRLYGGIFIAAPKACIEQPGFEVCIMARGGMWNALRYGIALLLGRLPRLKDVTFVNGRHVAIDGTPGAPVQADGDVVATLPVDIAVAPSLALIFPEERSVPQEAGPAA